MHTDDKNRPARPRPDNDRDDMGGRPAPDFSPLIVVMPAAAGPPDPDWLARLRSTVGNEVVAGRQELAGLSECLDGDTRSWPGLVGAAARRAGGDGALLIESGLVVADDFFHRLGRLAAADDCPPLTLFAGNHDSLANPASGLGDTLDPMWCDAVAALAGRHAWTEVDHACPRLAYVAPGDPEQLEALAARGLAWVYDGLFVYDPGRPVDAGSTSHPALSTALGKLRLSLTRLTRDGEANRQLPAIGRDGQPVTLHVSHHWGGGVARWIEDVIGADAHGHHLVLAAGGDTGGKVHGQWLRLYATGPLSGLIDEWVLTPAIGATEVAHGAYRDILDQIVQRFGVGRVVVSSLIGHSLDALATGLPTLQVLHDYYPAWPVLDRDPLQFDRAGRIDLASAIAACDDDFLFDCRQDSFWQDLAGHWARIVEDREVAIIAPTAQVVDRWKRLSDTPVLERARIVPHGFRGWDRELPVIRPRALADGRLNLVVVGRLSPGKGLGLLEEALPQLTGTCRITLVGAGQHGMRLFGRCGVDILLDYERDRLPELLQTLAPQAVLFLSTVAETWNYVLSETRSLGLVPVATRTGSFIERIRHEHDGLLFDPDAACLVEVLESLHRDPGRLARMAANLPTETTVEQALAECDRLAAPRSRARLRPHLATPDAIQVMARDARAAEASRETDRMRRDNQALYEDLVRRTAWAQKHERLTAERTNELLQARERIEDQRQELVELNRWARQSLDLAQAEIHRLDTELRAVHESSSWRLTRPLRLLSRLATNARRNRVWNPLGWPALLGHFGTNVRVMGLKAALDHMQHLPVAEDAAPAPDSSPPVTAVPPDHPEPASLPRANRPQASIIIPVYNKYTYTAACLHSIADHAGDRDFEVIVVDDCSSDQTADYLSRCQGIRVVRNRENAGFIRSCNAGAEAATGDYLVFLNNDTTVTRGWLDALLSTFEDNESTGVAGARLVYPDGTLQEAGGIVFNDASGWNYGRGDRADRSQYNFVSEADYVSGACLAIRREDFEAAGGFDTRYVPAYYEDTDLCFRVREMGKQVIYQPAATVVHHEGISSGTDESTGTKRYQAVNREKFRRKWARVLATHPAPEPRHERSDPVRHLRFRRQSRRLLLVDAVTPQPDHDSGSVRIMAMMSIFRDLGFQVTFMPQNLAWVDGYSERLQQAGVEVLCTPGVDAPEQWLAEHGRDLDLVVVSRHYVLAPLLAKIRKHCPRARLVFDTVDLHFLREQREAEVTGSRELAARAALTRRQELALIGKSDTTLVVSAAEKELLADLVPEADIRIVSNIHQVHGSERGWAQRRDLMFVGGFQHAPNTDAARWLVDEIFPRVRRRIPEVRLHLIGSRMPAEILTINEPGVSVHGFVPDLKPYLQGCRLSVAPLRYGAGVKGKVNQAMSHGLPVVATPCAAEGMFLEHGKDVLIADDAEGLADCVVHAYTDESLWSRLSIGGLDNVDRYFSMAAARQALSDLVASGQGAQRA